MAHARKQIRDELKTVLTGLTTTGVNVFFNTIEKINNTNIPAILIFSKSESIEYKTIGKPQIQERTLSFEIIGVVKENDTYQDEIDTIILEIENAINNSNNLSGKVKQIKLESLETEFNDDLEKTVGTVKLTYSCLYQVRTDNLELIL